MSKFYENNSTGTYGVTAKQLDFDFLYLNSNLDAQFTQYEATVPEYENDGVKITRSHGIRYKASADKIITHIEIPAYTNNNVSVEVAVYIGDDTAYFQPSVNEQIETQVFDILDFNYAGTGYSADIKNKGKIIKLLNPLLLQKDKVLFVYTYPTADGSDLILPRTHSIAPSGEQDYKIIRTTGSSNYLTSTWIEDATYQTPLKLYFQSKLATQEGKFNLTDIDFEGDSLTMQGIGDNAIPLVPQYVRNKGYGGETSYQLLSRYLATGEYERTKCIWIGRNDINPDFSDESIMHVPDVVTEFIKPLTHDRFIILGIINGDYTSEYKGTDNYNQILAVNNILKETYRERYFDPLNYLREQWNYLDINLESAFVQPSIGGNVQIVINDSSALATLGTWFSSEIVIGYIRKGEIKSYVPDKYEIVSIDSTTLITIKLLEANNVSVGETVRLGIFADGGTTGNDVTLNQRIYINEDYEAYTNGVSPATTRADLGGGTLDPLHLNEEAYTWLATKVLGEINKLTKNTL